MPSHPVKKARKPKKHTPRCELLFANDTTLIAGLTCSCPDAKKYHSGVLK